MQKMSVESAAAAAAAAAAAVAEVDSQTSNMLYEIIEICAEERRAIQNALHRISTQFQKQMKADFRVLFSRSLSSSVRRVEKCLNYLLLKIKTATASFFQSCTERLHEIEDRFERERETITLGRRMETVITLIEGSALLKEKRLARTGLWVNRLTVGHDIKVLRAIQRKLGSLRTSSEVKVGNRATLLTRVGTELGTARGNEATYIEQEELETDIDDKIEETVNSEIDTIETLMNVRMMNELDTEKRISIAQGNKRTAEQRFFAAEEKLLTESMQLYAAGVSLKDIQREFAVSSSAALVIQLTKQQVKLEVEHEKRRLQFTVSCKLVESYRDLVKSCCGDVANAHHIHKIKWKKVAGTEMI